ncbi:hypothetical protein JHW43_000262 [Diplocarpon mali]|nr:hypothetical protein JHW43_000262 [Diplocarpon mali]
MTNNGKPFSFGAGSPSFGSTPNTTSPFGAAQPATSKPATTNLFGTTAAGSGSASMFGSSTAGGQPSLFAPSSNPGSGTSTPSFGGGNTGAAPVFGSSATTSETTGSGLFSTAAASSTSFGPGFSFGQSKGTATQATNNVDKAQSADLSSSNNAAKPTTSTSSSNPALTGSTTPSKPTFSFQNSTTPAGPPPTDNSQAVKPSLFGSLGAQQPFGGGFGTSKPSNSASASASTLFPAAGAATGAGNLFNKQPAPASTSTGLASTPATAPQAPKSPFSFPASNPTSSTPKTQSPLTGPASKNVSLFNKGPATSAAPSLFGGPAATSAAPSSDLLGGTAPTTTAPGPPSMFAGLNGTTAAAATSATPAPSTTAAASRPTPGLFSTSTSSSTPSTTAPPVSGLSDGLGGDSGSGGGPEGLGGGAAAASGSGPATAGSAQTLGASTAGPVPQLNRLKNKTMDDIITRWASDLSKYQKEFQEQAEKVATWDRLMVENGDKIQKLYLTTYEAEKQSTEIERQLANVESQQDELASWLDRYEGEVDEMFQRQVGHGETLQGPDQERERTYKLAEKLTDRLDDMGKNLTSMIEAINDASTTLSKTSKADDPLSHIVRVLNSHLTQLQWIDENATALQSKIVEAQKAGLNVGSNGGGYTGPESDAADSFYRSFAGRK